jgi:hypothetical protein
LVNSGAAGTGSVIESYASGDTYPRSGITLNSPSSFISFGTGTGAAAYTERMRVTSAGDVGVGTSSPASKLNVSGSFNAASTGNYPAILGGGTYGGGIGFQDSTAVSGIYTQSSGTQLVFFTGQTSADNASSKIRMLIDGSGNVGVGTTSPSGKLHVSGGRSYFTANSEQYDVALKYNAATSGVWLGSPGTDAFTVSTEGGAERMRIDSSGKVSIGKTSALVNLDVLDQVSKPCKVFHCRNFLALNSVCIDSDLAHNLLLAWFANKLSSVNLSDIFVR